MAKVATGSFLAKFFFGVFWAVVGVPMSFMARGNTFYACLLVAVLPLTLTVWRQWSGFASSDRNFDKLLALAGMSKDTALGHHELGTAIAIDRQQRKILLAGGGASRTYGYGDVRSWNALSEGFCVNVRDIDHAEWKISMIKRADQTRWMEILTQSINESHAGAQRVHA